ncbi:hypothetical protein [Pseudomonas svalbardensis]|uniref:hypothetical protein n=1 Tax=Pseudomonas svalbardensis TaxID=3042029 RepID=UPI0024B3AF28|nr:hypothetical protein [Pseudomonas sp. PMCC200367]
MTKQGTYDEREGFRPWNYVTCWEDIEGQEVWRINVKVKRVDEVVIPLAAADHDHDHDHGLVQVAEREVGARMMAERSTQR